MNTASGTGEAAGRRALAWGAGVAIAWHMAIFAVLDPAWPNRRVEAPRAPAVRYLPLQAADAGAAAAIETRWSPLLFSLPSPLGFSRARGIQDAIRPPVDLPDDPVGYLPRPVGGPSETAVHPPPLPPPLSTRPGVSPPAKDRDRPARHAMTWIQGARGVGPPPWAFPVTAAVCGNRAWTAVLHVGFDDDGLPRRVLLDPSDAPPEVAMEVVRGAWKWRNEDGARDVRLQLRFEPAVSAAEPEGKEIGP